MVDSEIVLEKLRHIRAALDRIREKMKDVDPKELQARIDQAVEEVKAESRPRRQASPSV